MTGNKKNRVVLVTGFGPFNSHLKNASWQAVKELKNSDIEKSCNITLVTEEIPVVYEKVSTLVPKLWSEHNPMLVIHVGVSSIARCLTLESRAHKTGYNRYDFEGKYPLDPNEIGVDLKSELSSIVTPAETGIDVKEICEEINTSSASRNDGCEAVVSDNAGRYLCEYIYHQSLSIDKNKSIFVHVPDFPTYSTKKTADGLFDVIRLAVKNLERNESVFIDSCGNGINTL